MTQLSGKRRERRRRHWFDEERPTLLVRLRLAASPEIVDQYRSTSWTKRDSLRRAVAFHEARNQLTERN